MSDEEQPWFVFKVRDTEGHGVEIPKVTRLLGGLSSAFYAIARARKGTVGTRPGRRTAKEETLADLRLMRITPGSLAIELAPPAADSQAPLPMFDELTADDIALDFYHEINDVRSAKPPSEGRGDVRRRVLSVVGYAGEIGSLAEIEYRPRWKKGVLSAREALQTSINTRQIPRAVLGESSLRRRHLSGHAYMVDVEPGRQRLRIKLPDGRDVTLEVDDQLAAELGDSLDRVVELQAEEEFEGSTLVRRSVQSIAVLPSSGPANDRPPKSVKELAEEQGMPSERPNYVALASAIWASPQELADFQEHLVEVRRTGTD